MQLTSPLWLTATTTLDTSIDAREDIAVRKLLWQGDHPQAQRMLEAWHTDFLAGELDEGDYHNRVSVAAIADIRFDEKLRAWLQAAPKSYIAHAFYAEYCFKTLYLYRGNATGNTVTPFRQLKMQEWGWKAFIAARHALELDHGGNASLVHDCLQNLLRVWRGGEGQIDEDELPHLGPDDWKQIQVTTASIQDEELDSDYWLRRAFDEAPDSFQIHFTALYNLTPQWGGSEQEMERFVEDSAGRLSPVNHSWLKRSMYRNLAEYHSCFAGDERRGKHFEKLAEDVGIAAMDPQREQEEQKRKKLDSLYDEAVAWLQDGSPKGARKAIKLLRSVPIEERAKRSMGGWFEQLGRAYWILNDHASAVDYALVALRLGDLAAASFLPSLFTDPDSSFREHDYGWQLIHELIKMDIGSGYAAAAHAHGWGLFGQLADIPAAWPLAMAAAHRGEVTPVNNLAQYLIANDRRGMPSDPDLALNLFLWAADTMDDSFSMMQLGRALTYGAKRFNHPVPSDPENGFHWLRAAVQRGDYDAAYWLGEMYAEGLYVEQNPQAALAWYDQCIDDDQAEWRESAAVSALLLIENELDDKSGIAKYLEALKGSENAATCFEVGDYFRFIAEKYDDASHYRSAAPWLRKAAQLGHPDAEQLVVECESKMKPGLLRRLASKMGWS